MTAPAGESSVPQRNLPSSLCPSTLRFTLSLMPYSNIRDILGHMTGSKLVDVTQHDESDDPPFVEFLFSNGCSLRFPTPLGFYHDHEMHLSELESDPED